MEKKEKNLKQDSHGRCSILKISTRYNIQTRIAIAKFIDKLLRHDRVTLFLFSFAYLTVKYVRG